MYFMGFLFFLAILLGIAIAQIEDPAFTIPDYSNPAPLHMVNNNGPMFRSGWDQNCPERNRAKKAFLDAISMAKNSVNYLNDYADGRNDGSMFTRYFDPKDTRSVLQVLTATYFNVRMVNNDYQQVTGPGTSLWNGNMKYIDMHYDTFPLGTQDGRFDLTCRDPTDPSLQARTMQGADFMPGYTPERVLIIFCKFAFDCPDLPGATDTSQCDTLRAAPYLTEGQLTLASIMFHELLHDNSLHPVQNAPDLRGIPIKDFQKSRFPTIKPYYPDNGYGPWNAIQLNTASNLDQAPLAWMGPSLNADSYTLFAEEVFWSRHCGVRLIFPPSELAAAAGAILPPVPAAPLPAAATTVPPRA